MKKLDFLFLLFFVANSVFAFSMNSKDGMVQTSNGKIVSVSSGLGAGTTEVQVNSTYPDSSLFVTQIPFTFNLIEYNDNKFSLGPAIGTGYGAFWLQGDCTVNSTTNYTFDPKSFEGISLDIVGQNSSTSGNLTGLVGLSIVGGLDNYGLKLGIGTNTDGDNFLKTFQGYLALTTSFSSITTTSDKVKVGPKSTDQILKGQ